MHRADAVAASAHFFAKRTGTGGRRNRPRISQPHLRTLKRAARADMACQTSADLWDRGLVQQREICHLAAKRTALLTLLLAVNATRFPHRSHAGLTDCRGVGFVRPADTDLKTEFHCSMEANCVVEVVVQFDRDTGTVLGHDRVAVLAKIRAAHYATSPPPARTTPQHHYTSALGRKRMSRLTR